MKALENGIGIGRAISISTSAFAQVYVDVPESHWAYSADPAGYG